MVAKVEWQPGELVPRVAFIVTKLSRSAERVTWFVGAGDETVALRREIKARSVGCLPHSRFVDLLSDWQ